jgi:hypothetical protein
VLTSNACRNAMTLAIRLQIPAMNTIKNPMPGMSPRIAKRDGA